MSVYKAEPVHHAMCDVYADEPGPCSCGLDALRARVAELEAALTGSLECIKKFPTLVKQ